jgi:hypothetical protein
MTGLSRSASSRNLAESVATVIGVAAILAACRGQTGDSPAILLERNMFDCERYNPESISRFFPDGRTMREPVEGTIAADRYMVDRSAATGLIENESDYVAAIPPSVVQGFHGMGPMLERGKDRYGIYCVPCHGIAGDGKGPVACKRERATDACESYGFAPLPSYDDSRIRHMADGQLFATISHGVRTMPAYAPQIPVRDRWAIVGYVRALELHDVGSVPPLPREQRP